LQELKEQEDEDANNESAVETLFDDLPC